MAKGGFNVRRGRLRGSAAGRTADRPPREPTWGSHGGIRGAAEEPAHAPLAAAGLLEALPDAALLVDPARRVVAANDRLRRLVGMEAEFRHIPESVAAFARRLALAGQYAFIGMGDLVEGGRDASREVRSREVQIGPHAMARVTAAPTPDGGTLLTFAGGHRPSGTLQDFAVDVLQRLPGAILRLRLDDDGTARIIFAGPHSHQIFAIAGDALVESARDVRDFVHPADRGSVEAMLSACRDAPGPIDLEFRMIDAGGKTVWTRAVGSAFGDKAGGVFVDLRLIDIAERVQIASEHRRLQRLLDMVVENIPHIITVRDISDMRFMLINRAACDLLGVDREKLLGRSDAGILPDEIRLGRRERNRSLAETRRPVTFPDIQVNTPHHGLRTLKTTKYPLFDDDGVLRYVLSINEDVTERRQAQDALRRGEQRLREALESFSDGLALFDGHDRLVLCNRRYRELWPGIAGCAKPGTPYADLVRATVVNGALREKVQDIEAFVARRVAYHRNPPTTREVPLSDGRWLQISDRATAEGGIVVTLTDITALKEREDSLRRTGREAMRAKEAAELANRSKSDFLANMSHELRTPLNAVIGFSEIIKDAMLGEGPDRMDHYRSYAADIHNSGRHLLSLINDILDMSKIEAGKLDLFEEPLDLVQCIESSLVLVRERARQSGVALERVVPDNLPRLRADSRKVKQILINLLSNAVKFTKGGGRVTVEAFIEESGEYVLRVVDTGIGIRPEDIGKVLEPFGQAEDGLARSYEGTGLGLTLTKSLVELHGGRLEIASRCDEPPTGTTVSAIFPAARAIRAG